MQILLATTSAASQLRLSLTDGQSASLSWNKASIRGLDQIFMAVSYRFVDVGLSLWREDRSVIYNFCWASPAESFSGPTPVGFTTIFYCLRFEIFVLVAAYDSQGYCGGIRPRLHTGSILDIKKIIFHSHKLISPYSFGTDGIGNTVSNNFSVVLFNDVIDCLLCRNLALAAFSVMWQYIQSNTKFAHRLSTVWFLIKKGRKCYATDVLKCLVSEIQVNIK
jgi:hypothetical protein